MTKPALIGAALAVAVSSGAAGASVNHVLGNDGTVYQFDAQCHRVSFIPPGISDHESINVVAQQVRCLVRRPDPFARCVRKATLTVVEKADHGPGKPGDEIGAAAAVAAIQKCASARY